MDFSQKVLLSIACNLININRSRQHILLLDLEDKGEQVYYVAPAFHSPQELAVHYANRVVCKNSIFVRPSFDGIQGRFIDEEWHHISFRLEGPWHFYSSPKELKGDYGFERFSSDVEKSLDKIGDMPLSVHLDKVFETLTTILQKTTEMPLSSIIEKLMESQQRKDKANIIAFLSSAFFNCQFVVVQKR